MKKQNDRSKRKLTSKQVTIIAVIIYAIYIILSLIYLINSGDSGKDNVKFAITILIFFISMIMADILLYEFVLKENEREKEEAYRKLKEKIEGKLQQKSFVEIELIPYEINKQTEMFEHIFKNMGCKFCVKLLNSGEILIVCKDRHNNTVYEEVTENYYYFEETFKFKKD